MESDGLIPLGTFIEFTWHKAGPEGEEPGDGYADGDGAQMIGVMGDAPPPSEVMLSDSVWKPRAGADD
jgi:hypothetical protein